MIYEQSLCYISIMYKRKCLYHRGHGKIEDGAMKETNRRRGIEKWSERDGRQGMIIGRYRGK